MASLTPKKALLYESLFSPVGDDNAKCNTCGKVLVSRDGNISGLWRHLNFNHKEKYNEFEKKKKLGVRGIQENKTTSSGR